MKEKSLIKSVKDYYEGKLWDYGATPKGVDWKDQYSQYLRFQKLIEIDHNIGFDKTIHEVGCGYGAFFDFVINDVTYLPHIAKEKRNELFSKQYLGTDISQEMIKVAKKRNPKAKFYVANILEGNQFAKRQDDALKADYLIASGLFNVMSGNGRSEWIDYVFKMLRIMFELCYKGIAVNFLSNHVDYRKDGLLYADPVYILNFCLNYLSKKVKLIHNYELFEYTIHIYKEKE